jgi:hypothetical protein
MEISFEGTYGKKHVWDFVRLGSKAMGRSSPLAVLVTLSVVSVLLLVVGVRSLAGGQQDSASLLAGFAMGAAAVATGFALRRSMVQGGLLGKRIEGRLDDAGIAISTSTSRSETVWAGVHGCFATQRYLLLFSTPRIAWLLPRDFFAGEESFTAAVELSQKRCTELRGRGATIWKRTLFVFVLIISAVIIWNWLAMSRLH